MIILSEFVVELDTTIVNIALPNIARSLAASTSTLQWIVDAYTVTFAGLLLLAGALSDHKGRRPVLLSGLVVFAAGSIVASAAASAGLLIAARALMGVGAALILPTTLSILNQVFPAAEKARAFSLYAATAGVSIVLGPLVGGALVGLYGWQAVFLINLPIIAVALTGVLLIVPALAGGSETGLDVGGTALSIAGLGMLVLAIIEAPRQGWASGATIAEFGAAAACVVAFLVWEARSRAPMLDLALFRLRSFAACSAASGLMFIVVGGLFFVITQYFQDVQGHSALGAGARMLPVAIMVVLGSSVSVALEAKLGTKLVVTVGLLIMTAGLALLTGLTPRTSYLTIAVALALAGAGYGLALTPMMSTVLAVISTRVGTSTALFNAVIIIGIALGVAILGSVLSSRYSHLLAPSVNALPPHLANAVRGSIGEAIRTASGLSATSATSLARAARRAFSDAAGSTYIVASAAAAAGALVAASLLPGRTAFAPATRGAQTDSLEESV